jgi:hypothetical protein
VVDKNIQIGSIIGATMSKGSRTTIGNTIKAIANEGFPHDWDSLRDLTISASNAWHENERCEETDTLCTTIARLSLPKTLKLLSDFMDIGPLHGACLIGALRRYITLHYKNNKSETRTTSLLLLNFEQSILTLHESFGGKERKTDEQKLAYEVLVYERAMVEKRRKFNISALNRMKELRRIINDEHGHISRADLLHQLFTFPQSPLAYVDLQTGLLRSRLGDRPYITLDEKSIDMTESIQKACDEILDWNRTDFGTSSKVRYFVFMKILIQRDRHTDKKSKPRTNRPWKNIDTNAKNIARRCATNKGLIRLMGPVLEGETSSFGKIKDNHHMKLWIVKKLIAQNNVDNIHLYLRESVGDISLNNPLKTAANNLSNLSTFTRKTPSLIGSKEEIDRYNFSLECMSNGVPKIINTGNALADAVFANALRWEKISKPAKRAANTEVNIEHWLAKSTGHLVKIDTSLGSKFSDITQSELSVNKNISTDFVGVLNQYMSGFQPLPYLSEEKAKSGRKKNLKISKTTKMNRISGISTCINEILSGLKFEGFLLEKDISLMDSDKYNLLILPQKCKDSWSLDTLHYTLLFNSLHLKRLVTHWHIGRTMASTTTLPGVYRKKLNHVLDKVGVLIGMELLHALTVLSIIDEVGAMADENVREWLILLQTEIIDAGANKTKLEREDIPWKHPSYERMFNDVREVLVKQPISVNGLSEDLENALFLVVKSLGEDVIQGVPKDVSKLDSTELTQALETLRRQHFDNLTNKEHNFSPQEILATRLASARLVQDFLDAQA